MATQSRAPYQLPTAVRPFAHLIHDTGGNDVEELVDDFLNNDGLLFSNQVRYMMAVSVSAQVGLLNTLIREGLLHEPEASQT